MKKLLAAMFVALLMVGRGEDLAETLQLERSGVYSGKQIQSTLIPLTINDNFRVIC